MLKEFNSHNLLELFENRSLSNENFQFFYVVLSVERLVERWNICPIIAIRGLSAN